MNGLGDGQQLAVVVGMQIEMYFKRIISGNPSELKIALVFPLYILSAES